ncbi:hypothetical protein H5410_006556 [Solanum commersonii]|uniref:Uncharacterized protein n=1 Tax=Solanum commersonii TaxID=4109 RepID=A0A9J6AAV1_SOLCO|nr:hypothetical protein H5410_006556 [Solanum commersonii]
MDEKGTRVTAPRGRGGGRENRGTTPRGQEGQRALRHGVESIEARGGGPRGTVPRGCAPRSGKEKGRASAPCLNARAGGERALEAPFPEAEGWEGALGHGAWRAGGMLIGFGIVNMYTMCILSPTRLFSQSMYTQMLCGLLRAIHFFQLNWQQLAKDIAEFLTLQLGTSSPKYSN